MKIMKLSVVLPLCLFLTLGGFLWRGLSINPKELPSALIGQDSPKFKITTVENPKQWVDESLFKDKVTVLNVWATWCVSCRKEHEVWLEIKNLLLPNSVQLIGLNYHDTLRDSQAWLRTAGNPYQFNLFDQKGQLGIDFGVYGTPETYVLDKDGIIRYRHVGPINHEIWKSKILPFIEELKE